MCSASAWQKMGTEVLIRRGNSESVFITLAALQTKRVPRKRFEACEIVFKCLFFSLARPMGNGSGKN